MVKWIRVFKRIPNAMAVVQPRPFSLLLPAAKGILYSKEQQNDSTGIPVGFPGGTLLLSKPMAIPHLPGEILAGAWTENHPGEKSLTASLLSLINYRIIKVMILCITYYKKV